MAREIVTKSRRFYPVSLSPDICKTPMGNSTPPIPYTIKGEFAEAKNVSPNISSHGDKIVLHDRSTIPTVTGDGPGSANGIKSGTVGKKVETQEKSSTVGTNGTHPVREGDVVKMNDNNTTGKIYERGGEAARPRIQDEVTVLPEVVVTAEKPASLWDKASPWVHGALGLASFVPGLSVVTSGADAAIYAAEGNAVEAGIAAVGMIPGGKLATTAAKAGKFLKGAQKAEEAAQAARKAEEAAQAARKAEEAAQAAKEAKAAKEAEGAAAGGKGGGKSKAKKKRKPKRRCELVPYDELECDTGQEAHHVIPDWMLRMGKRGGTERIPDMPSLAKGPAICLEGGSGNEHNTTHKQTDRPAQRIGKNGRATGVPGTITLGQAKGIASRAIEKATGGKKGGGCDRKDIQKQLDEKFKAPDDALLRGVKDARKVTNQIKGAVNPTEPKGDM